MDYWAVHPYTLTNARARPRPRSSRRSPAAGPLGLTDDELKAKPDNFYADELKERLRQRPRRLRPRGYPREAGDPSTTSPRVGRKTSARPSSSARSRSRPIEPDATCDASTFDPVVDAPGRHRRPQRRPHVRASARPHTQSRLRGERLDHAALAGRVHKRLAASICGYARGPLASSSRSIAAGSRRSDVGLDQSSSCSGVVALAIGAVSPGLASSHAIATRAGVEP